MKALTIYVLLLLINFSVCCGFLFEEDFENDLSKWIGNTSGKIVVDPLNDANKVLTFDIVMGGGDIFS